MKLFTIGFAQKRAQTFFDLLHQNGVKRLVDIRLNPEGQLAGFAKKDDLPFFLLHLAGGCEYVHLPELAPTKEILTDYREDKDWERYEHRFLKLLTQRNIPEKLDKAIFEQGPVCLLCSEPTAEKCHRRLVAERLAKNWGNIEVFHL
jgi:uncharacterized protein (DUF488 family)